MGQVTKIAPKEEKQDEACECGDISFIFAHRGQIHKEANIQSMVQSVDKRRNHKEDRSVNVDTYTDISCG